MRSVLPAAQAAQDLFALLCAHRAAFQCAVESGTACEVITSTADSWDELVGEDGGRCSKKTLGPWGHGVEEKSALGMFNGQVGVLQGG